MNCQESSGVVVGIFRYLGYEHSFKLVYLETLLQRK